MHICISRIWDSIELWTVTAFGENVIEGLEETLETV